MGKLIKYEFQNFPFKLLIACVVLIVLALIQAKIPTLNFYTEDMDYIVNGILLVPFGIYMCIIEIVEIYIIMKNFYADVYDVDCYLGVMSPIKSHNVIISKLISAFVITLMTSASVMFACLILPLGQDFDIGTYALGGSVYLNRTDIPTLVLIVFSNNLYNLIFMFWCVCVGEKARVHKVIAMIFTLFVGSAVSKFLFDIIQNILLHIPSIAGEELVQKLNAEEPLYNIVPSKTYYMACAVAYIVVALIFFIFVSSSVKKRIKKYEELNKKYDGKLWQSPFGYTNL
jgi:ABC-2 type transport system ATP-binding protein